jgi:hypothetical protein
MSKTGLVEVVRDWFSERALFRDYNEEVDRYRYERELVFSIHPKIPVGYFRNGSGVIDVNAFKRFLENGKQTDPGAWEEMQRIASSVAEKYEQEPTDIAALFARHELEIMLGDDYATHYHKPLLPLMRLRKRKNDDGRMDLASRRLTKVLKKRVRKQDKDRKYVPAYCHEENHNTRNRAGFFRTSMVLPVSEGDEFLTVDMFTKFFQRRRDWLKNNIASEYLVSVGAPCLPILASTAKNNIYLSTTQLHEGRDLNKILEDNSSDYTGLMKTAAKTLADIHILGGRYVHDGRRGAKSLIQMLEPTEFSVENLQLDLEEFFIARYTLRKHQGKEQLERRRVMDGHEHVSSQVRRANKHYLESSDKKYGEYQALWIRIKKHLLNPLINEQNRQRDNGTLAFLTGDAHTGNYRIGNDGKGVVADLEMAGLGLAEFDLYFFLEDRRNIPKSGDFEKIQSEILNHYWSNAKKLRITEYRGIPEEIDIEMHKKQETYLKMRCLLDFTSEARFTDKANNTIDEDKKQEYLQVAKFFYERAIEYLPN